MRSASPKLPDDVAYQRLRELAEQRYGIVAPEERTAELRRKLATACRSLGHDGLAGLYVHVTRNDLNAVDALIRALTVNHTGFFREVSAYKALFQDVVPTLKTQSQVRIWSSASSSGEELYTMAFYLLEELGYDRVMGTWQLLGTDLDQGMIRKAETGIYSATRAAGIPPALRERYLTPLANGAYQVKPRVRELCIFRRLNLLKPTFPFRKRFDAVFCRNVLYYFTETTQASVLRNIHAVTRPGGWLVTGVSESLNHLDVPWHTLGQGLHTRAD